MIAYPVGKSPLEEALEELVYRNEKLAAELAKLNAVLRRKNIELDSLHFVWCDGGCETGMYRYGTNNFIILTHWKQDA